MQHFTSTRAKQAFGELLRAAALGPVAIERHGKVQAIVTAPGAALPPTLQASDQAARQLARAVQAGVEKDRLIRHQRIAIDLLTLPAPASQALMQAATAVVSLWRREQLCSSDYIERWQALLSQPLPQLAVSMASDLDGWGSALRQNSPWVGVRHEP